VQRVEKRADVLGILVDERPAANQPVADEERIARDALERGHFDGQHAASAGRSAISSSSASSTFERRGKRNTHSSSTIATSKS
jgi:hypothetical protein